MATDATGTPTALGIPKYNTSSDPPSGKGFNAAMDAIDALIAARLAASSVTAGASVWTQTRLLSGDTQPAFEIFGNGTHWWGPGGSTVPDTNLYRKGADYLGTDDTVAAHAYNVVPVASGAGWAFTAARLGDSQPRYIVDRDGVINWGNGSNPTDTSLYRRSAADIKTDGVLRAGASIVVEDNGTTGSERLYFGQLLDTNLYRSSADNLRTDDSFTVGGNLYPLNEIILAANHFIYTQSTALGGAVIISRALGDTDNRFTVGNDGKFYWGNGSSAADVTLYRNSANELKTDDNLSVDQNIQFTGSAGALLHRVQTAGHPIVAAQISGDSFDRFQIDNAGGHTWGGGSGAADVGLSRTAANELTMSSGDTFKVSDAGLKFNDGTVQTTAATGTKGALYTFTGKNNGSLTAISMNSEVLDDLTIDFTSGAFCTVAAGRYRINVYGVLSSQSGTGGGTLRLDRQNSSGVQQEVLSGCDLTLNGSGNMVGVGVFSANDRIAIFETNSATGTAGTMAGRVYIEKIA